MNDKIFCLCLSDYGSRWLCNISWLWLTSDVNLQLYQFYSINKKRRNIWRGEKMSREKKKILERGSGERKRIISNSGLVSKRKKMSKTLAILKEEKKNVIWIELNWGGHWPLFPLFRSSLSRLTVLHIDFHLYTTTTKKTTTVLFFFIWISNYVSSRTIGPDVKTFISLWISITEKILSIFISIFFNLLLFLPKREKTHFISPRIQTHQHKL